MVATRRGFIAATGLSSALAAAPRLAMAHSDRPAPFSVTPDPQLAWLVANENPYGPSPRALRAIAETADQGAYYGFRGVAKLAAMVAERNGVSPEQVVIGTGSTELLNAIALVWSRQGAIVCPEFFFDLGVLYAERLGADVRRVKMLRDMQIDLAGLRAATEDGAAMVQLCNPNNPTGMALPAPALHDFARRVAPLATLLVDEAYNELADDPEASSAVPLVREGLDVIVTRTFSKIHGLAGLRVGYAIASEENAAKIRSALMNSNNSVSGLAAAAASYDDDAFLQFSRAKIVEAREMILDAVNRSGLSALPSQTNFVCVRVPDADLLRTQMRERDVAVRGAYEGWPQFSRVSCGKLEHVARYCSALPEIAGGLGWDS